MKMSHNVSIKGKPNDNQSNLKMSQLLVNRMKNRTKNMKKMSEIMDEPNHK